MSPWVVSTAPKADRPLESAQGGFAHCLAYAAARLVSTCRQSCLRNSPCEPWACTQESRTMHVVGRAVLAMLVVGLAARSAIAGTTASPIEPMADASHFVRLADGRRLNLRC